jgi:hypothetical protein
MAGWKSISPGNWSHTITQQDAGKGGSSAHMPTVLTRCWRQQLDFASIGSGSPPAASVQHRRQRLGQCDVHKMLLPQ